MCRFNSLKSCKETFSVPSYEFASLFCLSFIHISLKPLESPFIIVPLCLFTLKIKNNHVYAINDKRGNRGSGL